MVLDFAMHVLPRSLPRFRRFLWAAYIVHIHRFTQTAIVVLGAEACTSEQEQIAGNSLLQQRAQLQGESGKHALSIARGRATKECAKSFPSDAINGMIAIDEKMLWCPNAKSGTSFMYSILYRNQILEESHGLCHGRTCNFPRIRDVSHELIGKGTSDILCSAFSFVIIRNPWDRIRSAYAGKVETGKIVPGGQPNMSFVEFVRYIRAQDRGYTQEYMDLHWDKVSHRCKTSGPDAFVYSAIYKLEDGLEEQLDDAFKRAGIELSAPISDPTQIFNNTIHSLEDRFKDYLDVPGLKYSLELVDIIADVYKDDIALGNYSFFQYG